MYKNFVGKVLIWASQSRKLDAKNNNPQFCTTPCHIHPPRLKPHRKDGSPRLPPGDHLCGRLHLRRRRSAAGSRQTAPGCLSPSVAASNLCSADKNSIGKVSRRDYVGAALYMNWKESPILRATPFSPGQCSRFDWRPRHEAAAPAGRESAVVVDNPPPADGHAHPTGDLHPLVRCVAGNAV